MKVVDVKVGVCYIADATKKPRLLNGSRDLPKSQSRLAAFTFYLPALMRAYADRSVYQKIQDIVALELKSGFSLDFWYLFRLIAGVDFNPKAKSAERRSCL